MYNIIRISLISSFNDTQSSCIYDNFTLHLQIDFISNLIDLQNENIIPVDSKVQY